MQLGLLLALGPKQQEPGCDVALQTGPTGAPVDTQAHKGKNNKLYIPYLISGSKGFCSALAWAWAGRFNADLQ